MRIRLLALAVPLLALAGPAAAQPSDGAPAARPRPTYVVDRVIAVVNDEIILDSELAVQLTPYEPDLEGIDDPKERARRKDKLRAQVLDEMIAEQLIIEAAAAARLEEITSKEVDQIIADTKSDNKLDDATFQQALAAQGVTLAQYRQNVKRQLTRVRAMKMLVAPKVNITDEEVRAQYDQMVRRSDAVSQVRLAHIQLTLPERPTDAEVAAARAKAGDIVARVRAGEEFGKLAAEFSDDANTKTAGGELGWIERGTLDPAWEQVVFALDPKEVAGPVAGPRGLEVFYVTEVKRTEMKPFDKMKDQIKGELQQRNMQKQTTTWIEELRKKAYIEVKL
ncbi:MAG: peptidylprolyl isomerase [Myxococcales bacterium]|nr:peptidylprolyl isomerase [Myxococcales bacterium]MBK7196021.1 peptidylprolyl isomerase [Myxococcales bacterium]MBP6843957.1 peptidylprolyl isomerase [Kofleriaceae bacterium]